MSVQFRLLGPVEMELDGRQVELGPARQRSVLAVLLVDADRVVPVDVVVDRVWADRLPRNARVTLSGYVSRLRRLLAAVPDVDLARQADGYRLAVDPMAVDLHRFRALVAQAGAASVRDDGAALLTEALGLWRGQAFATLDIPWFNDVREKLEAERFLVELDRNDFALDHGQHATLLGELSASATAHPWDERLAGQLMLALYRCGRQADALDRYERLRSRLAREFGADPSPALQRLHQRMLSADHALAVSPATGTPVPRQLPAPPASFTGRTRELADLDALMGSAASTVVISAISGTAGVGKTALALHWAHQTADKFPDGQLYVNLRGFDPVGTQQRPGDAVRGFLDALGVSPHRIPDGVDTQAALYRSLLAGRQVLIVLDNARGVDQVLPLLPGAPGCVVVVTSRNQLTALISGQGAHPLTLDLLSTEEARELLGHRIGFDRVAAEPDAVDEIIAQCARLPLALTIAAARAAAHPRFPLHTLAAELRDNQGRLGVLVDTDPRTDVHAVFSCSYDILSPDAARLFRLLGLHPGPDIAAPAAASLAGLPLVRIRPLLAQLAAAHLLTEQVSGRYNFHDLLRAYALAQAHHQDTAAERRAATHRMLDHYLHTAHTATRLLDPYQGDSFRLSPAKAGVVREDFADQEGATAWFTDQYPALLAAIEYAAHHDFEAHSWALAWALGEYSYRRGHWLALAAAFHTALGAAERRADRQGQAHAHRGLGITHQMQGQYDQADTHLQRAFELFGQLGDRTTQAAVLCNLAMVTEQLVGPREALAHAQHALDLQQGTGDQIGQARALNSVGWYHVALGDHHRAVACLEQALTLLRETSDRLGQAAVWDSLGYAHHHLGQHAQAIECYHHAVRLNRQLGERYFEASTLDRLGDTHHAMGNLEPAHDAWRQAVAVLDDLSHPDAAAVRAKHSRPGQLP
ncbi:AfsR/SARP family transcriptional regulator [Actinophytocola sp.]|uniref:AfsR/SARP family transcriptional regulator n=1 Tax=Actinophytocola sp. TaxID=1872138 RepID=UPI002ED11DAD